MPDETPKLIRIVRATLHDPELRSGIASSDARLRRRTLEALGAGELSSAEVRRVIGTLRGGRADDAPPDRTGT